MKFAKKILLLVILILFIASYYQLESDYYLSKSKTMKNCDAIHVLVGLKSIEAKYVSSIMAWNYGTMNINENMEKRQKLCIYAYETMRGINNINKKYRDSEKSLKIMEKIKVGEW